MTFEAHEAVHRHEAPKGFIRKYIFSLDHKVIGIQYIMLALVAVLVGMTMSVLMRMNLSWPGTNWPILGTLFPGGAPNGVMNPEFYLSLVTMHGTIMVFFVLTTAPQGGFGNYFLPMQIGADDMAFPFLNMMSFWVTFVGFVVLLSAIFFSGADSTVGWMDWLCAAERPGPNSGAGTGNGDEPMDYQHCYFLHRLAVGSFEFHHYTAQYAHQRNVLDAHAFNVLGLVYHGSTGTLIISRTSGRRNSLAG